MKSILYINILLCCFSVFSQDKRTTFYRQRTYQIDTLSINTKNSDFGISYLNDGEVVFSSPKRNRLFLRKWYQNSQGYLELFKGKIYEDGSVRDIDLYSRVINSRYHESNTVITKDGKIVYFTSNNQAKGEDKVSTEGYNNLQLYRADIVSGTYENIQLLPFNSKEYSTGHPALSNDGKTLYFVSDRPGGFGETDLYKVSILENNEFGEVLNLGSRINTSEKEMFPFIDIDGVLYFSSDRNGTKGGLDVYGISLIDLEDEIYHLEAPINSEQDDFGFVLGKQQFGFLSSNRETGIGDDDIYKLRIDCIQNLSGIVYNKKDSLVIKNAKVFVYDEEGKLLDSLLTDVKGEFNSSIVADCNTPYFIKSTKQNFKKDSVSIVTSSYRNFKNYAALNLEPEGCLQTMRGLILDSKTKKEVESASVYLYDQNGLIDSVYTNKKGVFKFVSPVACDYQYTVKAAKKYFKGDVKNLKTPLNKNKFENRINLELTPYIVDNKIDIEPIYFDLNKSFIRPDAAKILDGVVDVMKKYPNLVIEGGSHTDSRGNDAYNEALSARRAKSTVAYIISKGISSDRISSKGYGESALINRCKNGVRCSKKEHQLNRRTEFKIVKK